MDQAHDWTDEQIEALQRRFDRAYSQAAREMREKLDRFLLDYAKRNSQWMRDIHDGKAKREDWEAWKRDMALDRQFMAGMVETLANDATRTNQLAFDMINDALPSVAAENANFAAYGIESRLGYDTHSFDLVDQSTVRRMMGLGDDGQILHEVIPQGEVPNVPWQSVRVNMDTAKDVRWNRQKFNAALTQSILQGESIPNAAKRLSTVLNMDKSMATRAARTAMTGAENAGRTDSYNRAKRIGIELEQEWMATLDERTRASHRQLDGTHIPVGEKFPNGLEFPGDPKGAGEEIWNCRCTLVAWFPDIEQEDNPRWSNLPEGMSYDDWKLCKEAEEERDAMPDPSVVTDSDRALIDSYIHGLYGTTVGYTGYVHGDHNMWCWDYREEFYRDRVLPELSDKEKLDSERMYQLVSAQNSNAGTVQRVESIGRGSERFGKSPEVGETLRFGVKSASLSETFVDDYAAGNVAGLPFDPNSGNEVQVFRVAGARRYLDVSGMSPYESQKEALMAGSYRVAGTSRSVRKVVVGEEVERQTLREKIESDHLKYEMFTSKKGKEMVRVTFPSGATRDYTMSQYNSSAKTFVTGRTVPIYQNVTVAVFDLVEV